MNVPTIGANFDISGYNTVKCTGDPNKDAKNFADANNITVAEAKKILSGQFGDPVKRTESTTDATKAGATNDVDDDVELEDDADIDDIDDIDETDDVEEDDEVEDDDDTTNNLADTVISDEVDTYIDDITEKYQEAANRYHAWAKSGYQYGGSKYSTALKDFQSSIADFLDYVDSIDMSSLDYSTRRAIDDAKDDARSWSDKFEKATKTAWYSDATLNSKLSSANKKTRNLTSDLITLLQNAGLATKSVTKPSKPTT